MHLSSAETYLIIVSTTHDGLPVFSSSDLNASDATFLGATNVTHNVISNHDALKLNYYSHKNVFCDGVFFAINSVIIMSLTSTFGDIT